MTIIWKLIHLEAGIWVAVSVVLQDFLSMPLLLPSPAWHLGSEARGCFSLQLFLHLKGTAQAPQSGADPKEFLLFCSFGSVVRALT